MIIIDKGEFKELITERRKGSWVGKQMYGQFARDQNDATDREKNWSWVARADLKAPTEALIFAAQEQAIRTNYVKYHIDKTIDSPNCRLCGERGETVSHIVSECKKLAQKEYKRRHDNVAKAIY